jgi:AcrR family transcriptional regulator
MPKIVDREQRREAIVRATYRTVKRIGMEATTLREIALEAGYSIGVIQHFFANKEELLIAAHVQAFAEGRTRIVDQSRGYTGLEGLKVALFEAIPTEEASVLESYLDISYMGHALVNERLREVRRQSNEDVQERWKLTIQKLRAEGLIKAAASDALLAMELAIFVDGVSAHAILFPELLTLEVKKDLVAEMVKSLSTRQ